MNKKYCYPSNFLALKFLQILIGSVDFFFFRTFFFFEYAKRILRRLTERNAEVAKNVANANEVKGATVFCGAKSKTVKEKKKVHIQNKKFK